jgi:hypothetical protein
VAALFDARLQVEADQGVQAPGVVQVPVGEDQPIQVEHIQPEALGVVEKGVGIAGVEEYFFFVRLEEEREAWLADKVAVRESVVVDEDA